MSSVTFKRGAVVDELEMKSEYGPCWCEVKTLTPFDIVTNISIQGPLDYNLTAGHEINGNTYWT